MQNSHIFKSFKSDIFILIHVIFPVIIASAPDWSKISAILPRSSSAAKWSGVDCYVYYAKYRGLGPTKKGEQRFPTSIFTNH